MDRSSEIDEEGREISNLILTSDDIYVIVKSLDAYASVLMIAGASSEFERVKYVAQMLIRQFPREEFDS